MDIEKIKEIVKETLSEKRFYHSICVMEMCEELAKHYNANIEEAKLVGIAHDIAKEMPPEEKIKYAKENNIPVNDVEETSPTLLHAKIGADICKKQFGFSAEMCKAISTHTTGGENMDLLSKILFAADGIGKDRDYPEITQARELAFKDLDEYSIFMLNYTIAECIEKNKPIHTDTILARNYLLMNFNK